MSDVSRFGYSSQEDLEYYEKNVAENMEKPENIKRQLEMLVADNKPEHAPHIAALREKLAKFR